MNVTTGWFAQTDRRLDYIEKALAFHAERVRYVGDSNMLGAYLTMTKPPPPDIHHFFADDVHKTYTVKGTNLFPELRVEHRPGEGILLVSIGDTRVKIHVMPARKDAP